MKKKILMSLAAIFTVGLVSGCSEGKDLTDKERTIIAEYAADVLLRYDKNYNAKYTDETEETITPVVSASPTASPEPVVDIVAAEAPIITEVPVVTQEVIPEQTITADTPQQSTGISPLEIGKLFGLDGVEMNYQGMEAVYSYPPTDDLGFKLDATSGCKLVVLKFELSNVSEASKSCNIIGQNIKFRMRFNGTDYFSVQKTLLHNDLASMNVILKPGEKQSAVVISQVQDGYESTISSIGLTIRVAGENFDINLK